MSSTSARTAVKLASGRTKHWLLLQRLSSQRTCSAASWKQFRFEPFMMDRQEFRRDISEIKLLFKVNENLYCRCDSNDFHTYMSTLKHKNKSFVNSPEALSTLSLPYADLTRAASINKKIRLFFSKHIASTIQPIVTLPVKVFSALYPKEKAVGK